MRERRDDTAKVSFTIDRDSTSRGEAIFKMALGEKLLYYPKQGFYRLSYDDLKSLLDEAKSLLNKEEYIQASEKYYKFMEESIKILAERYAPEVCEEASHREGWGYWRQKQAHALNVARDKIVEALKSCGKDHLSRALAVAWSFAMNLHGQAFHEFTLTEKQILEYAKYIEEEFWKQFREELKGTEELVISFYRGEKDERIMYRQITFH